MIISVLQFSKPIVIFAAGAYHNKPMYEASIGAGTKVRDTSRSGNWLSQQVTACTVGNGVDRCMSSAGHGSFWIQWKNNQIQLGRGKTIGNQIFWKADVASVGYDVKYLSFAGGAATQPVWWRYYDGEDLSLDFLLVKQKRSQHK